jgi:choline kinase
MGLYVDSLFLIPAFLSSLFTALALTYNVYYLSPYNRAYEIGWGLTYIDPKPLIPLLGLRLIEWVIMSVKKAEIDDIVIVVGYLGGKIKRFLGDGSRYGVKIKYVKNNYWKLGNGVSVYVAKKYLRENFILLMSDHIFDPRILFDLKNFNIKADECALCVDTGMRYVFDVDDATKVKVVGDKIVNIGKDLSEFNGVDIGIFLCSPEIFKFLKRNLQAGSYTLTGSIKDLAERDKMKAYCIGGNDFFWIDIDTFEMLRIAENILLRSNHMLPINNF